MKTVEFPPTGAIRGKINLAYSTRKTSVDLLVYLFFHSLLLFFFFPENMECINDKNVYLLKAQIRGTSHRKINLKNYI